MKIIIYKAGTKTVSKYKNDIHGTEKPIDVQKENNTWQKTRSIVKQKFKYRTKEKHWLWGEISDLSYKPRGGEIPVFYRVNKNNNR